MSNLNTETTIMESEARQRVSKFLRVYRATFDLTQKQMSDTLGCSLSTYNQVEQGTSDFRISFIDKISEGLKVEINDIFFP